MYPSIIGLKRPRRVKELCCTARDSSDNWAMRGDAMNHIPTFIAEEYGRLDGKN